jgi:hypothetical protein
MATKDITDQMVCEAVERYHNFMVGHNWNETTKFPYEDLSKRTGEPEKVCFRAVERAYNHGLIEYGVSLRTGWLTDKGKDLINESAKQNIEEER